MERNMKTKIEKVMELTPITMGIDRERDTRISKRWSHKGLDLLINLWHKYYNNTAHLLINSLFRYREKELNLEYIEPCLKDLEKGGYFNETK